MNRPAVPLVGGEGDSAYYPAAGFISPGIGGGSRKPHLGEILEQVHILELNRFEERS